MDFDTVTDRFLWPNTTRKSEIQFKSVIQVSVVLPAESTNNADLVAAQKRAGSGILVGFEEAARRGLTRDLVFNMTFRDSNCTNRLAPKSFTDAIVDGVDVLFGPSCDFALGKKVSFSEKIL